MLCYDHRDKMDLLIDSGILVFFIVVLHVAGPVGLQVWRSSLVGCFWVTPRLSPVTGNGAHISAMTLEACNDHCRASSSTFFAAQGGNWCHCDEGFDNSKVTGDYFCRTSCSGDINQTTGLCGTRSTVAVYWVCPVGYYGRNCTQRCSVHFRVHKNNPKLTGGCYFNGTCFNGCDTGWKGSTCFTEDIHVSNTGAPSVQSAMVNTDAVIRCIVSNQPRPDIAWMFRGRNITNDTAEADDRFSTVDGHSLKIVNATPADSGNYTCRVRVDPDGRNDERVITFLVRFAPKIVKSRLTVEEFEGSNAVIYCKANGEPRPKYRFYKDKTHFPLPTSSRVVVDDVVGLVKFQPLKAADNGTYTCRASNDVGIDTAAGTVKVKVREDRTTLQATVVLMCAATTVAVIACVLVACKNHRVSAPKPSSAMLERAATEGESLAVPEATVEPQRTQRHERSPAVQLHSRDTEDAAAVPSISLNGLRIQLTDLTPSAPDANDVDDNTFIETPPPRYDELFGGKENADQVR